MSQVTVISGVERRRRWSDDEKLALVEAAMQPGANMAEIARRGDLWPSQLYRWRRELLEPPAPAEGFSPVLVTAEERVPSERPLAMVIELRGVTMRIAADASPALVTAALRALRR